MIKPIVKDIFFLGQKSEAATKQDLPVGQDLMDTLRAKHDRGKEKDHYCEHRHHEYCDV